MEWGIAEKEALAVQLCLMNLPKKEKPKHVRIHVDNLTVVHAYKNKGSRNLYVHKIIKWLWEWQQDHECLVTIIYVNTLDNLSDAPSREIDLEDEVCVHPKFLQVSLFSFCIY